MNSGLGAVVFVALTIGILAGCGTGSDNGSSGDKNSTASDASSATTSNDEESAAAVDEGEAAAEIESPGTEEASSIEWYGPPFVGAAEARMAELEAPFGQPYSADAVDSIFEMPAAFPVVPGTITGIFSLAEVDFRDG